ncbi:MAG: asparagine synthase (glutamine-hydrolyzing) [Candidatus Lloydbacteria bacterium RIFCSPHIGHO2_01_FULL_49_22]|uniref:asparagine synthase (glutamine-hydrolyzing) n=1 Tax=Candidatus Lloydbacteria bacterium RIFCSPHIGHO2_01_FULL_49_22 TaxID=1798658 RepID=A0A1G2CYR5_9BACT|nr:MAG: asparagine synthase (glutamine-hydrolyzing) [Candidatus Lloydbacteria bacterium RIFCSPHIGHO2_01_FULL_49_22]OGZ08973.1 MAG: asparagine synthase (glutamine-hydrolyzing) [Candidatus Lloydbacteria bacterium RIFCSPHIGHO2_02_FULL_50_18]
MCGINGFINSQGNPVDLIGQMNDATKHRGPDGVGSWSDELLTLGQNLLAITETPQNAKQPSVSRDGNYVLVYNGEIYNYKELRKALEGEGVIFHTDGDTEVIFEGLMRHGPSYFAQLDGMFAIAFYEKQKQKVFLARDRAGMKPLYIAHHDGAVVFSSEMRGLFAYGIPRVLDIEVARSFFIFGYTPSKETLIKGIVKLPPGSLREIDLASGKEHDEWFGWSDRTDLAAKFTPEILRQKFGDSVHAHTMGLRPFGLFLSGGLDSTVILHELAEKEREMVKTYTTRFETKDTRYNEDADLAAKLSGDYNIQHHELLVTERMFIDSYEEAILAMEEPRYNPSVPAYWLLAQMASKDITVVLNGSGGDELFLGYPRYQNARNIVKKYERFPKLLLDARYTIEGIQEGLIRPGHMLHLGENAPLWAYVNKIMPPFRNPAFRFMDGFDMADATAHFVNADIPPLRDPLSDRVNAIAELDRWFWLANEEFMRTDKVIMHFGMEGRFPFLANDLVRYANGISSEEKLRRGKKSLVREAYQGKLPEYILNKKKTGWNAPVTEWMSSEFGAMVRNVLTPEYYPPTAELFDFSALTKRTLEGKVRFEKADLMEFLPIVQFQVWARVFNVTLS